MDFNSWLNQIKIDEPELESFITRLEPLFTEVGFKCSEFERKVTIRLDKIDSEVGQLLKSKTNVED